METNNEKDEYVNESEDTVEQVPQETEEGTTNTTTRKKSPPSTYEEWVKPKHKYLKLEANAPKLMHFRNTKGEYDFTDFNGKLDEPVPVVRHMVTTPEMPNEEQEFTVTSKRLATTIQAHLDRGIMDLEITRLNTNPVSYQVIGAMAQEKQQKLGQTA
jgi:hypothetical protein